jgi:hypothetical protein
VSPWLSRQLRVVLWPEQVMLAPVRRSLTLRGVRRTIQEAQVMSVGGASAAAPWRAALLALEAALPDVAARGRTTATVVLSNQFARYALVPWQAGLAGAQEDLSYTRHCFTKVYGKAARDWEVRLSHQAAGIPRLASGVDAELLEGLRSMFARPGITLRSVQPHLMVACNGARRQLRQRSAWIALLEPGHLCLALLRDGDWSRVRSLRIDSSWRQELPNLLEREVLLVDDAAVPNDVYVGHLEPGELVLPEVDGWQFHALEHGLRADSALAEPVHVAVAMAG